VKILKVNERMLELAPILENITLEEWKYLKTVIDESFSKKIRELEPSLKLSCENDVTAVIRSRFE
jgi:hypothetical protein